MSFLGHLNWGRFGHLLILRSSFLTLAAVAVQLAAGTTDRFAWADPAGLRVAGVARGSAEFHRDGNTLSIRPGHRAVIHFARFEVSEDASLNIIQSSPDSRVLLRVDGVSPSKIHGRVSANGVVILVNPAGVEIGPSAVLSIGELYAATAWAEEESFFDPVDRWNTEPSSGAVTNMGEIAAGAVHLSGRRVANHGSIAASPHGRVSLTAGDGVLVDEKEGAILVNSGSVKARSISLRGDGGEVHVSGSLDVSNLDPGGTGGCVEIIGRRVAVPDARIDASGDAGGGTIHIGRDFQERRDAPAASRTFIGPEALIRANAGASGDGGKVLVWADEVARFFGSISARGGQASGNGGFAEVSGREDLEFSGSVDLRSPDGENGTLLLDPNNITIQGAGPDVDIAGAGTGADPFTSSDDGAVLTTATIELALATASVRVATGTAGANSEDGDILIIGSIDADAFAPNNNDLTLQAHGDIVLSADIDYSGGTGNLTLQADFVDGDGSGAIIDGGGIISLGNGGLLLAAGSGIGSAADPIETVGLTNVAATTSTGGIFLNNAGSGAPNVATVATTSGLTTTTNGDISLTTSTGDLTVSEAVSLSGGGSINLVGATNLTVGETITTTTGNISLLANNDVVFFPTGSVIAGGAGSVTVSASGATGTLNMSDGALIDAGSGTIALSAGGDITLGGLVTTNATSSAVTLRSTSGGIVDGGDSFVDVSASIGGLVIEAATGVGSANAIETTVASLDVDNTTSGNIDINETDAVSIIRLDQGAAGGAVTLVGFGAITVDAARSGVRAVDGQITLDANGAASDLSVNQLIASGTGAINLLAQSDIVFSAAGDVTATGAGSVTVAAGGGAGALNMSDGALIDAGSGTIALSAGGDITLGGLVTTNATSSAVTLRSTSGGIVDGGDSFVDVVAAGGRLVIDATTGVGGGDAIETTVASLDVDNATSGNISINETDAVSVIQLDQDAAGGAVTLVGFGAITVDAAGSGASAMAGALTLSTLSGGIVLDQPVDSNGGDVVLDANGDGLIDVNAPVGSRGGAIRLDAEGAVDVGADVDSTDPGGAGVAGEITIRADSNGNSLFDGFTHSFGTITSDGTASDGDITIRVGDDAAGGGGDIAVGAITAGSANLAILANGGSIAEQSHPSNLTANILTLATGGASAGIGAAGAGAIEGTVAQIAGQSGSGGFYYNNGGSPLVVGDSPPLDFTDPDGVENESISNVSTSGALSIGTVHMTINTDVIADPVFLTTPGSLTINANIVNPSGGAITLTSDSDSAGAGDLVQNAGVIQSTGGTIAINAGATATSTASVTVSNVDAGAAGTVTISAPGGAVNESGASDAAADIAASLLTIDAAQGVGGASEIEISVAFLDVNNAASGDIALHNLEDLQVNSLFQAGAGAVRLTSSGAMAVAGSGVTSSGGAVLLEADNDGPIDVNAAVSSLGGAVALDAEGSVDIGADVDSTGSGSAGAITIRADSNGNSLVEGFTQSAGTMTSNDTTSDGDITIRVGNDAANGGGDIRVGAIDAGSANLTILANGGPIVEHSHPSSLTARILTLATAGAAAGVGASGAGSIDGTVATIAGISGDGGFSYDNGATPLTVGDSPLLDFTDADAAADEVISGINTGGTLGVVAASLTVNSQMSGDPVGLATTSTLAVNANITNPFGGSIDLMSDMDDVGGGDLDQSAGTIRSIGGTITIHVGSTAGSTASATISNLDAGASGSVAIASFGGSLNEAGSGDAGSDITAGILTVDAAAGVGGAQDIETSVAFLDVDNTTSGDISIAETDDVALSNLSQAAPGTVTLRAGGAVTQTGPILAGDLEVLGAGPYTLTDASNDVGTLAADVVESLSYVDSSDLTVGAINATVGVTSHIGAVNLTAGGDESILTISQALTAAADSSLAADNMAIDAPVTVGARRLTLAPPAGSGDAIDLGSLLDTTADTLELSDAELDNLQATTIQVGDASSGAINISSPVSPAAAVNLALVTSAGVTQVAGGSITVGGLRIEAGSTVAMTEANDVATLAALVSGAGDDFSFTDTSGLTVGTVDTLSGITTNGGDVTLNAGGPVARPEPIVTNGGTITIIEGGNQMPVCDANGPYVARCEGAVTRVALDGTGSDDPDGEPLAFSWTTDCPAATFDDPASPTPALSVASSPDCAVECTVTLTVTDGSDDASCSAPVTVEPPPAQLAFDKSVILLVDANADDAFSPGDTLRYTISFENAGIFDVTAATISDDYDETLLATPVAVSDGGVVADGAISWSVGTIAAGTQGSVTYEAEIRPAPEFPQGTTVISNTAVLATEETEPISASVDVTVQDTSTVRLEPIDSNSVHVVVNNNVPIKGGEIGISYDPGLVKPIRAEKGPDFPQAPGSLILFDCAATANNCPPESEVEAGLALAWVNSQSQAVLTSPGEHRLLRILFTRVSSAENECSPLAFATCLGPPEAPIRISVTGQNDESLSLIAENAELCIGEALFVRGDANDDGRFDISDSIKLFTCLFLDPDPRCLVCRDAADANDDGNVDISDPVWLLAWRFTGGPPPPPPLLSCDADPTDDSTGCERSSPCEDCVP